MRPLGLFTVIVAAGAGPMVGAGIWLGDSLAGEPIPPTPLPSGEVREDFGAKETPFTTKPMPTHVTPTWTRIYKTPHGRAVPKRTRKPSPTKSSSSPTPTPTLSAVPTPSATTKNSFAPVLEESSGAAVLLK